MSLFLRCGCFDLVSDLVTTGLSLEGCDNIATTLSQNYACIF